MRYHERCWLIRTAGRWPWKSESAKECVTTHLPNQLALKMDGAGASDLYRTVAALRSPRDCEIHVATSRQVAAVSVEALGVSPGRAAAGADLGGSSKYSNENFED